MNLLQKRFEKQSNTLYEVSYAILQQPTNAAFIPKKTMEINEETESIRQEGEIVHSQSALAKD